ncbi:MAG: hypothetical protein OXN92_17485 [Gammaproteobacteria bacterium]|nr:hypothetical protein [Gammaproteobacteria bacterium]
MLLLAGLLLSLATPGPRPGLYEIKVEIEIPDHPPVSRTRRLRVTPPVLRASR